MVSAPSSDSSDFPEIPDLEEWARTVEEVPGFVSRCGCGANVVLIPCPNPPNVGRLGYSCTNPEALAVHTRKFWDVAVSEEIQLLKDRIGVSQARETVNTYYVERLKKLEMEFGLMRTEIADCVTRSEEVKEALQSRASVDKQFVDALWALLPAAGTVAVVSAGVVALMCGLSFIWLSKSA